MPGTPPFHRARGRRLIRRALEFSPKRFWTAIVWCLLSGWLVQPVHAGYGHVPMYFVENQGQFQGKARYVVRGPRLIGYFASAEVVVIAGPASSVLRVSFPGANPAPVIEDPRLVRKAQRQCGGDGRGQNLDALVVGRQQDRDPGRRREDRMRRRIGRTETLQSADN